MIFDANDHSLSTMVSDDEFVYHPLFTDLPYFDMSAMDANGSIYDWDFVFANIGGKNSDYTHLSVHTGLVSTPFFTDFGLGESNTVVYLTYANTGTNTLYHDASLAIIETVAATIVQIGTAESRTTTKADFFFADDNVYDITEAGDDVLAAADDLFDAGDAVAVAVNQSTTKTTFVNTDDEFSVVGVNALLLPFHAAVADVQDAVLKLSDDSSVDVSLDQASGNISVGGTTYSSGDYFVMDNKKVTVYDI